MTHATVEARRLGWTFYYGWVVLGVAALAMVGTLPGRTQGLGLITEPLLRDLAVDRVRFAQINLVATLVGSLFCFGIGGLVDRHGSRVVLAALALLLGGVVLAMSSVHSAAMLLVLITLTRGLGQSALSVVSLAMPGKWFRRRLTWAMGVYALVMSIGFMLAFPAVGALVLASGWRYAWAGVGVSLVAVIAPVSWIFTRSTPESAGQEMDGDAPGHPHHPATDATLAGNLLLGQAGTAANGIATNAGRLGNLTGPNSRACNGAPCPVNLFQINPTVAAGGSFVETNDGSSFYDALQIEARRRMSRGLAMQASYVFGKSLANTATSSSTDAISNGSRYSEKSESATCSTLPIVEAAVGPVSAMRKASLPRYRK